MGNHPARHSDHEETAVLLERAHELDELSAAVALATRGRATPVVIEGPAGAGKTRLLQAARDQAHGAGLRTLTARGEELERGFSFGVARQLLAAAVAAEPTLLEGPAGLAAPLFDRSVRARVSATGAELVHGLVHLTHAVAHGSGCGAQVTVDDLQWADHSSLRFLTTLVRRPAHAPLAVVVAVRTGEDGANAELLARIRAAAMSIAPAPLTTEAIAALVTRDLGRRPDAPFTAAVARATGGNPFLVVELLAALRADGVVPVAAEAGRVATEVPGTVLRAVIARLSALPRPVRALAAAAAVLGDAAPLAIASGLARTTPEDGAAAADALAAAGILRPGQPLRFAHPLIAAAVLAEQPPLRLAGRHRAAADLLATDGAPSERIAAHLAHATPSGDPWTVRMLRDAAAVARARGEAPAAVALLTRALGEPPASGDRGAVLVELAGAEATAGAPQAMEHLGEALPLLPEDDRARASLALTDLLLAGGAAARAVEVAAEARAGLDPQSPLAQRLAAAELLASGHAGVDHQPAIDLRISMLRDFSEGRMPSDPTLLAMLALMLAVLAVERGKVRAIVEVALAEPLLADEAQPALFSAAAPALLFTDEFEALEAATARLVEAARTRGAVLAVALAIPWRALGRLVTGDLPGAIADASASLAVLHDGGWSQAEAHPAAVLALARLELGEIDEARAALAAAQAADPENVIALGAQGRLALRDGDPAAALAAFEAAGRTPHTRAAGDNPAVVAWRSAAAIAHHALGDADAARALAEEEVTLARRVGLPRPLGVALRSQALVTGGAAGLRDLERAVASLRDSAARLELARTLVELGAAQRRAGKRGAAREALVEALDLADRLGAAPVAARAHAELRVIGARPRRARRSGPESLTVSERRVAGLAAAGDTNAQIARTLFLSPKTIEWHLGHVYKKLDVRSRRELAGALAG